KKFHTVLISAGTVCLRYRVYICGEIMFFMRISAVVFFLLSYTGINGQPGGIYKKNKTLTYTEVISSYDSLDLYYGTAKLLEYGPTDSGENLRLFLMAGMDISNATVEDIRENKVVILINNGIHPGEPCGIDASL